MLCYAMAPGVCVCHSNVVSVKLIFLHGLTPILRRGCFLTHTTLILTLNQAENDYIAPIPPSDQPVHDEIIIQPCESSVIESSSAAMQSCGNRCLQAFDWLAQLDLPGFGLVRLAWLGRLGLVGLAGRQNLNFTVRMLGVAMRIM